MEEDTAVNFACISDPPPPKKVNGCEIKMVPFGEPVVT